MVTGANRGIGLELCSQLQALGYRVVAACRKTSLALQALGVEVVEGIDVTRADTLAALAAACEGQTVDIVVNNAGLLTLETLDEMNIHSVLRQFEGNALGPLAVTWKLLPFLTAGSKVAIVSAASGSIASKAAVNVLGTQLAQDVKASCIAVGLYHTSLVETDMPTSLGAKAGENVDMHTQAVAARLLSQIGMLDMSLTGCIANAIAGDSLPW